MLRNIEKIVEELRLKVPFKEGTQAGDVILIVRENEAGLVEIVFARVIGYAPEIRHRQEWWHVDLVLLSIPLGYATFVVNADQLSGKEIFTIKGRKVFIKAVDTESPIRETFAEEEEEPPPQRGGLRLVRPRPPGDGD
ncbi:MAG: hypothetical protein LBP92_04860 [Deltaproteobacteria bacterium]|jgi:hypothetical protein|nr:hypothetical protein [Deltaproteobacteria bacterium]